MLEKKGFTLVELIVAMAIIVILTGTAVVNFGKNSDRDARQEKDRLTAYFREVQNRALTGDRENISLGGGEKLCGIGVYSSASNSLQTYFVKTSDLNADCANFAATNPSGTSYGPAFYLNNNVTILGGFSGKLFFLIPNGTIYRNGSASGGFPVVLNLTKTGLSSPIPVTIEQSGRIY